MHGPQRVLIVDDHPILLRGLRATLEGEDWVEQIIEATTVADAVREAVTHKPDLVVMDVRLPDGDGIDATRRIVRAVPAARVLILTMDGDDEVVTRAMEAGAHGYLLKDLDTVDLVTSLRAVAGGSVVLGPHVCAGAVMGQRRAADRLPSPFDRLSGREREILTLLVASESTTAIARKLGVSEKTIRNQMSGIFHKIGAADRVQAALKAQRAGLMP